MRIAIIDESAARASIICDGLATLEDCGLFVINERRGLLARIAGIDPDMVLMDLGNPSRDVLEEYFAVSRALQRPIAMFVDQSDDESIVASVDAGVSSYVREDVIVPESAAYWTRSRVEGGWLYELADDGPVDVTALLPDGGRIEAFDGARGMRRVAVVDYDGTLKAAVYLTRSGALPARAWVAGQLGLAGASTTELLAARPSTPLPDRGAMVCVCHGIGETDIVAAVEGGAETVAQVGACTRAGTNCGSCRPAIARLIEACTPIALEAPE